MQNTTRPLALLLVVLGSILIATAQEHREDASHVRARYEDFLKRREPKGKALANDVRSKAITELSKMQSKLRETNQAEQPKWTQKGPLQIGGRIKNIVVDPTNNSNIYIAAAAGGVWNSTDAGERWSPMMDFTNAIAMGALCMDPEDPKTIYAGTGEQVRGGSIYLGAGLMKSTDAGQTWSVAGLTSVGSFSRVFIHPKQPTLMMASAMNADAGVWKSTDKGLTWTRVLKGQAYDMSMDPTDPQRWVVAMPEDGLLVTTDGGTTWTPQMSGINGAIGRSSVMIAPSNPKYIYALVELDGLATIVRSTDGGKNYTMLYRDAQGCFFAGDCSPSSSQAFYDNLLTVNPRDANHVIAGGIDLWMTTNGGSSWANVTNGYADGDGGNGPHVDQHCVTFDPIDENTVYAGNDGGMLKSTDKGATWKTINNNLAVTQFYAFDVDRTARDRMFGGTQDNGTLGTEEGTVDWERIWGGDGMVTLVDPSDGNIVYCTNPNGSIVRLDFARQSARGIMTGINTGESAEWVSPLAIDPFNASALWTGRQRVYFTDNKGDVWAPSSPQFLGNVSAITCSPADEEVIWAGGAMGDVWVTTDYGMKWSEVSGNQLSMLYVSDIACDNEKKNVAWVTYSTYGTPQVWRTTDMGKTWEPRWSGMPDLPVNSIELHPDDNNIVFVGTDLGVFVSFDAGDSWMPYGKGLPRSPVLDLRIDPTYGYVRAATHGRSIWETSLLSVRPSEPLVTSPVGGEHLIGLQQTVLSWTGVPSPVTVEYSIDNGSTFRTIARDVTSSVLQWQVPNAPTSTAVIRVSSQTSPNIVVSSRTFSIGRLAKGIIQSQRGMGWIPYGLSYDGKGGLWTTNFRSGTLHKIDPTTLVPIKTVVMKNAGDSLFTDLCYDREKHEIYVHRLNSGDGASTQVVVVDTNGNLLRTFPSAARRYGIGIELVNGTLYASERDGERFFVGMNPQDGQEIFSAYNPFQQTYGPRGLTTDGRGNFLQVCTGFAPGGGALQNASISEIPIPASKTMQITDALPLESTRGLINARGVELDTRDETMWISDINGTIWKFTGLRFIEPPITSVNDEVETPSVSQISIIPHPVRSGALISLAAAGIERDVSTTIYDITGLAVMTLPREHQSADELLLMRIPDGKLVPGTYVVSIDVTNESSIRRTFVVCE
ncbi:MAG: VPS10 domain-containing protein [Ignavibacteria bacterium]